MLEAPLHLAGPPAGGRAAPTRLDRLSPAAGRALPRWAHSVVSGAAAALSPKRPGRHPRRGTLSYRSRWVVVACAAWPAARRWPQDAYLLVPGALCWPPRPGPAAAGGAPARPRLTPTGGRHAPVAHPKAPTSNPNPATAPEARTAAQSPTGPSGRPPQPIGPAAALLTSSADHAATPTKHAQARPGQGGGDEHQVTLDQQFERLQDHWHPKTVATLNDDVSSSRSRASSSGPASGTDELFVVIDGQLRIQLHNHGDVLLRPSELFVVPRGVRHCPAADQETAWCFWSCEMRSAPAMPTGWAPSASGSPDRSRTH
jgi:mannose-6-phosphate isomerase-like protein (cupin superfamily)